jgi:hypothetical protein
MNLYFLDIDQKPAEAFFIPRMNMPRSVSQNNKNKLSIISKLAKWPLADLKRSSSE